jgi:hypothetical protein
MKLPRETNTLFDALRQSAKPKPVRAIEKLIQNGPDRDLCRINALAFAAKHRLDEEDVIAAFCTALDSAFSICLGTSFVPVVAASSIQARRLRP